MKLNPSTDPNIFQNQSDPNWTTIPVAPGVGLNNSGTVDVFTQLATLFNLNSNGPNPAGAGTGLSELQVDINQIQTVPMLFNSFAGACQHLSRDRVGARREQRRHRRFRPAWKTHKVCSRDVSRRKYHWSIRRSS